MDILLNPNTLKRTELYLGQPSHALGITGENGAGRGYLANFIASKLLKTSIDKVADHPFTFTSDVITEKTGIDRIRELQDFLKLKVPGREKVRRVVIMEHIDFLGHEAQNALLKTLEEPPEDTVLFITFANRNNVLPTIISRLQHIEVLPVSSEPARNYFSELGYAEPEVTRGFHISGGLMGLMHALISDADHPIHAGIEEARILLSSSRYERLSRVDKLSKSKELDPGVVVEGMYRLLHAGYVSALNKNEKEQAIGFFEKLCLANQALNDINNNVQLKIVLNRLFYKL